MPKPVVNESHDAHQARPAPPRASASRFLRKIEGLSARADQLPCSVAVHTTDGATVVLGKDVPAVDVFVHNKNGMRALASLNQLAITEAYMRQDIDIEGDLIRAMSFAELLNDKNFWIKTWRWLKPMLIGRVRCNPAWIQKHYDSNNIQLICSDREYNTYTPGIYDGDRDTLEEGAARKLGFAFESLNLKAGDRVLDIGCGWGGFLRYSARRNIRVTGITLSKDQLKYVRERIGEEGIDGEVLYQDFFTYEPSERFDGISMMGVIEDLSDYARVMKRLPRLLKPGGRVYLDFAAAKEPDSTASFITKYVWPGIFRMVYMPELLLAIVRSPFEIVGLYNDRLNYHLWAKKELARWIEQKSKVNEIAGEATWRMFAILIAATASIMDRPSHSHSAYRLVLELPADAMLDR
jgi:cyclopropane-fatty-acyl-phospholipid synthase